MTPSTNNSEIILYTTPDGTVKIDTVFQNETIWLTQKKMAELFGVKRPAITKHLKNIFEEGELDKKVVSSILEHTTQKNNYFQHGNSFMGRRSFDSISVAENNAIQIKKGL